MTSIEDPPRFSVRTLAEKAAVDYGFRTRLGERNGWLGWALTTATANVWIAAEGDQGPWYLSITHKGAAREMTATCAEASIAGPGLATFTFASDDLLTRAVDQAYRLAISLPDAPLEDFEEQIKNLPRTTEAERLVVQRIGQDIFRKALLDYWNACCPLTGITDTALLRASHIVPWADCSSDAQRLDVHNGLLLSSLWDAAFDAGLVSFTDDGQPLGNPQLSATARVELRLDQAPAIQGLKDQHKVKLAWHREHYGFG